MNREAQTSLKLTDKESKGIGITLNNKRMGQSRARLDSVKPRGLGGGSRGFLQSLRQGRHTYGGHEKELCRDS